MKTTEKYGFNKPENTDFYNIEDQNENWDKVDELLETAGGGVEITLAEYEALGDVVNSDGVTYFIKDDEGGSSGLPFRFGIDADGNYGYIKVGADTVTPFSNPYLKYNEDSGYIQVLDADGNWQDYIKCEELPIPTADVLYLDGKEYITWSEGSVYTNTYTFKDNITKYEDRMVLTSLGTNNGTSGGIYARYTFDNKFNYLHIMNSAGTIATLDCSSITGTYYILFNVSGWDGAFRFAVSPYTYNFNQNSASNVTLKQMDTRMAVNGSATITKIWIDNKA